MRSVSCLMAILLFLAPALAVEVVEKGSGLSPSSIDHRFPYPEEEWAPIVIEEIQQTDVISVIYDYSESGLPISYRIFFKNRVGESWRYEILDGERNLDISLGEQVPLDINGDGDEELILEYTSQGRLAGTFTLYPVDWFIEFQNETPNGSFVHNESLLIEEPEVVASPEEEAPPEEPANESDFVAPPPKNETDATAMPKRPPILPVTAAVLLILLLGVGGYLLAKQGLSGGEAKDGGEKVKAADASEAENLQSPPEMDSSKKLVSRSPRMRRRR